MKKTTNVIYISFITLYFFFAVFSCTDNNVSDKKVTKEINISNATKILKKPSGIYFDTLIINFPAAVFYHPDSVQLKKIKELTDPVVYDGTMHEYFFQMRNSRMVINKTWPALKIIESKNYRYLLFIKKDGSQEIIDLDTKNDAYGLFVFNGKKPPRIIDMTNIETEISFYLSN